MPPAPKSSRWCFTINNFTPDDEVILKAIPFKYLVYGKEVGAQSTPHLQGFITFPNPKTLVAMKKLHASAHWEITKKSSENNIKYCKKGEQSHEEWDSLNTAGPNYGLNADVFEAGDIPSESKGKRSDLDDVKEAIKSGMNSLRDLRENFSDVYARYPRFIQEYITDNKPPTELVLHEPRQWQVDLKSILEGPISDRHIHFVVDGEGNQGKSWFVDWYSQTHPEDTLVILPGKKVDMAYAVKQSGFDPRVVFVDAPRSKTATIQYDFLEELKNGRIFNTKYESCMVRFPSPHVVVMMNHYPNITEDTLSADRPVIHELTPARPLYNPPDDEGNEFENYCMTGRHDSVPVRAPRPATPTPFISKPARPRRGPAKMFN